METRGGDNETLAVDRPFTRCSVTPTQEPPPPPPPPRRPNILSTSAASVSGDSPLHIGLTSSCFIAVQGDFEQVLCRSVLSWVKSLIFIKKKNWKKKQHMIHLETVKLWALRKKLLSKSWVTFFQLKHKDGSWMKIRLRHNYRGRSVWR